MRVKVMYLLEPTEAWKEFQASPRPTQKRDHNGQLMFEKWPRVGEQPPGCATAWALSRSLPFVLILVATRELAIQVYYDMVDLSLGMWIQPAALGGGISRKVTCLPRAPSGGAVSLVPAFFFLAHLVVHHQRFQHLLQSPTAPNFLLVLEA